MLRRAVLVVGCTLVLAPAIAHAQQASRRPPIAPALSDEMIDTQKWAGEQIWLTKETVDALPGRFAEMKDQIDASQDDVQKLRDEVKGLYVEIASLREQLAETKSSITEVDDHVASFRNFSSFFLTLVVVCVFAMTGIVLIRR